MNVKEPEQAPMLPADCVGWAPPLCSANPSLRSSFISRVGWAFMQGEAAMVMCKGSSRTAPSFFVLWLGCMIIPV